MTICRPPSFYIYKKYCILFDFFFLRNLMEVFKIYFCEKFGKNCFVVRIAF